MVWALLAFSALYWGLRLFVAPVPVPAHATEVGGPAVPAGDLGRVLGVELRPAVAATAPPPPEASRYQLIGVVAPRGAGTGPGVALIALDGLPAKAYRIGARVDGDNVLQAVQMRTARLGPRGGPALLTLELPPLPPPATGTPVATAPAPPLPLARPLPQRMLLPPPQGATPSMPMPIGMPSVPMQPMPAQPMPPEGRGPGGESTR